MDRKRVLLAEDDPDTRFLLAMVLSEHGSDVIAAPDGVEALALAELQAPDLMVVDQMMPRMTGNRLSERDARPPAAPHRSHCDGYSGRRPRQRG